MLLRIKDHDTLPAIEAELATTEGFLGRLGGPHRDGHLSIELWHGTAPEAASRGTADTWLGLQDIEGIYDALPRALMSTNHLRLEFVQVEPTQRDRWVREQRRIRNPALAGCAGFLGGCFSSRPQFPGQFLELSLWQTREAHDEAATVLDAPRNPAPRSLEVATIAVLRRLSLEPAG